MTHPADRYREIARRIAHQRRSNGRPGFPVRRGTPAPDDAVPGDAEPGDAEPIPTPGGGVGKSLLDTLLTGARPDGSAGTPAAGRSSRPPDPAAFAPAPLPEGTDLRGDLDQAGAGDVPEDAPMPIPTPDTAIGEDPVEPTPPSSGSPDGPPPGGGSVRDRGTGDSTVRTDSPPHAGPELDRDLAQHGPSPVRADVSLHGRGARAPLNARPFAPDHSPPTAGRDDLPSSPHAAGVVAVDAEGGPAGQAGRVGGEGLQESSAGEGDGRAAADGLFANEDTADGIFANADAADGIFANEDTADGLFANADTADGLFANADTADVETDRGGQAVRDAGGEGSWETSLEAGGGIGRPDTVGGEVPAAGAVGGGADRSGLAGGDAGGGVGPSDGFAEEGKDVAPTVGRPSPPVDEIPSGTVPVDLDATGHGRAARATSEPSAAAGDTGILPVRGPQELKDVGDSDASFFFRQHGQDGRVTDGGRDGTPPAAFPKDPASPATADDGSAAQTLVSAGSQNATSPWIFPDGVDAGSPGSAQPPDYAIDPNNPADSFGRDDTPPAAALNTDRLDAAAAGLDKAAATLLEAAAKLLDGPELMVLRDG